MVRRGSSFENTSTLGIWVLVHFSDLHDKPAGRTVTSFVTPHLVRFPHLPSAAALRCHPRTVTSTTDRHRHDGPSWTPSSHTWQIILLLSSLPLTTGMTDRHRHNFFNYFFDLHDESVGRTIMSTTVRHALRNPTLGQTFPSSFRSCTLLPPTDRHEHDGLSKLRRWSLLHFFAQKPPHSSFEIFPANKEKLI